MSNKTTRFKFQALIFLFGLLLVLLGGCVNISESKKKLEKALNDIEISLPVEVDAEFITIPVKSNGLSIQWASSNGEVARIFVDKIIITPSGQDETIFLTAKIGLHGYYDYRIFKFNVKGDLTVEAFVDVKFETDGVQVLAPKYLTQYTITFDTQGGSAMEPVMQYFYTTIDVTSWTPTRDGYTFAGWAQPIPSRITEDITLVATWTAA